MSAETATPEKTGVTLLRMGVGKQVFELPDGATLGNLLRLAGIDPEHQAIYIDARPLQDVLPLRPGMIVPVVPKVKNSVTGSSWRETVGMFRDDPGFGAMIATVDAERKAEKGA